MLPGQLVMFLLSRCSCVLAAGLYTPADGQVWAQVGGCMAGRVGIDTLWVPFNPTTCSTEGGSIYYPNYPLKNGTNIGYMLFFNAAGEVNPLPGDNSKITGIVQGQSLMLNVGRNSTLGQTIWGIRRRVQYLR